MSTKSNESVSKQETGEKNLSQPGATRSPWVPGQEFLWDQEGGGGLWVLNEDGSKGTWIGCVKGGVIDYTAKDYEAK